MAGVINYNVQVLHTLQQSLYSRVQVNNDKISIVKLPFYNHISLLLSIWKQYTNQSTDETLSQFIFTFIQKHCQSAFQFYRHAQGLITMWKKYCQAHQEAKVYLSLLQPQRNNRSVVKLFLKIRKEILRNTGFKYMQEIQLSQQDIILLTHRVFTGSKKIFASKQIHQMYFSIKKKSLYKNKQVNGAYLCQFLMHCSQQFEKQEQKSLKTSYSNSCKQNKSSFLQKLTTPFTQLENNYCKSSSDQRILSLFDDQSPIPRLSSQIGQPNQTSVSGMSKSILKSQSPDKQIINLKYSYSWQKYLQTNQQIKQKLLKPHKLNY